MIRNWLRGLALLRHPELVASLGGQLTRLREIGSIRREAPQSKFSDRVVLIGYLRERFELGPSATVSDGSILAFGDELNGFGSIRIGRRSWLGEYNNLRACGGGNIVIGADCLISQFCTLIAGNHAAAADRPIVEQGVDPARLGVTLDDDVWLGAGVIVLPGVTIGRGAIVGANSVVNRNVPPYEIWAGSPARQIGSRQQCPSGVVRMAGE
jgi:acetyltransferase-like isoleucine patch superfamily enzyme